MRRPRAASANQVVGYVDDVEMVELAQEFASLAAELHGEGDNDAAMQRLVQLAAKHITGCSWASITVLHGQSGRTLAASDDVATEADQLQYRLRQGPCLDAAAHDRDYLLIDIATESRWPEWTAQLAQETPVRAALSMQLPSEQAAALNLFADRSGAFTDDDLNMAAVFAAHASTLVSLYEAENRNDNLRQALDSNRVIGQAIGILMAYHHVTDDQAFTRLREISQRLHRKLREVAEQVVETGALPELPPTR